MMRKADIVVCRCSSTGAARGIAFDRVISVAAANAFKPLRRSRQQSTSS